MINYPWCFCLPRLGNDIDDLCYLFACTARKTWWDLCDSQRLDISISEDSITDMLLLEMLRRTKRIICERYPRQTESELGADWLWWFVSRKRDRGFPMLIQAKRLYPIGRYKALKYKKYSRYDQTNTLLRIARKNHYLPLFCLYNFWRSPSPPQDPCWGCTLASAQLVKNYLLRFSQQRNDMDSILLKSIPWCNLVCPPLYDSPADDFPDAVRRRVMRIPGIRHRTVPAVRSLPPEVQQLLSRASDEDSLRKREVPRSLEDYPESSGDRDSIAGIIVVSDQPIEGRA